jgi:hypothetical protein
MIKIRNHKLPNIYIYIYIYELTFDRERRGKGKTKHKTCGVMTGRKLSNQNQIVTISTNVRKFTHFLVQKLLRSKTMASWVHQFFTFHHVGFFLVDEEGE